LLDNERSLERSLLDPLWTIQDVSVYLAVPVGTLTSGVTGERVLRRFALDVTCVMTPIVFTAGP
jgi:hypothetical protein